MRYANEEKDIRLYTEFLTRHERCNFQQSPEWARVKANWKNEIVLAEDADGNIIGGLSVLIRKMPLFGNLMYSARGPVCDIHDENALRQLMEGAELLAMKYNAMALRMEPDVPADDECFRAIMTGLGCRVREGRDAGDVIQPRRVFRLDIAGKDQEQVLSGFSPKLRYNIRLAQRRGVEIRRCGREELAVFHRLLEETGRRDGFLVRPLAYFQRAWDALGPEHISLLLAYFNGRPIAGAIPIHYGNKTWYAFGASSSEHRSVMPNYLLQWEMIKDALARHDAVYDLRGVLEQTDPSCGLYLFKSRFGADLTEFIGEVYVPYRAMAYRLYRRAERAYMALRDKLTGLRRRDRELPADTAAGAHPLPWGVPGPGDGSGLRGHMSA